MLIEFAVNDRAALLYGPEGVNGVYSAGLCCTALGYLAFPLVYRLVRGVRARRLALALDCLLVAGSAAALMLAPGAFFLPCAFLGLLSAGYLGGAAHYLLALGLRGSGWTGRVVGLAIAGESLLQFLIQGFFGSAPLLAASVAVCAAAIPLILRGLGPGPARQVGEGGKAAGRGLAIAGAAVCLMSVVISLDDTIAVFLDAEGSVDLTGVVRLSYAGAVLLYILSASSVVYLTVAFLELAPGTAHPELWAGMGRVLRSFSVAATAVPFIRLYGAVGHAAMMCVAIAATVAVLALFFAGGQLSPGRAEKRAQARDEDRLALFAGKYGLTPRETDVLAAALFNDKAPKEIAYDLQISERIVQRYFNSIYEKTGTQGRVGLTLLYSGCTPGPPSGPK